MNKLPFFSAAAVAAMAFTAATATFGQSTEQTVAFRARSSGEYVGTVAQGGLRANSKVITPKQIFRMVDLKDGGFADGDEVKIKEIGAGSKPTFWQETGDGDLMRAATDDASCVFKLKKDGSNVLLQTASGKFVAVDNRAVVLASEPGKTTAFELVLNPVTSEGGASKPAATEEAAKAAHTPATNVVPAGSPKP